jgi:catechol 2,3-dioxygenase-like lactoylglutathione lyase family enzyme
MKGRVSKIDHIGIVVEDLEKSLRPYQELLGLELRQRLDVRSFVQQRFCLLGKSTSIVEISAPMEGPVFNWKGEGHPPYCFPE